jgi:hypothetical protein
VHIALYATIVLVDPKNNEEPFCEKEVTDVTFVEEMGCFRYVTQDEIEYVPLARVFILRVRPV